MKKGKTQIFILILLGAGMTGVSLILSDYLSGSKLISRDRALDIAIEAEGWNAEFLEDKSLDVKLLHKNADNYAFVVDQKTMQDVMPFCPQATSCITPFELNERDLKNTEYLWVITVRGQTPDVLSGLSWGYVIDAKTGQVIR